MSAVIRLSYSAASMYEKCPRKYRLSKIERWREQMRPWYFAFGRAYDEACLRGYLAQLARGETLADPVATFTKVFTEEAQQVDVYNGGWDFDTALECGQTLAGQFPEAWEATGLMPLLDTKGEPIIARRLAVDLGHNLVYEGEIDVLAMDYAGRIIVVDAKTCGTESMLGFASLSAQPLDYHILVRANSAELGVQDVDGYAFFEALKKKKPKKKGKDAGQGPITLPPRLVFARSDQAIADRIEQLHWIADDIRRQRFPMQVGASFDSPCKLCEFQKMCQSEGKDTTGLARIPSRSAPTLAHAA